MNAALAMRASPRAEARPAVVRRAKVEFVPGGAHRLVLDIRDCVPLNLDRDHAGMLHEALGAVQPATALWMLRPLVPAMIREEADVLFLASALRGFVEEMAIEDRHPDLRTRPGSKNLVV